MVKEKINNKMDKSKIFTARCPKCKGIVMASISPPTMDKEFKKELMELITQGCSTQTEDNNTDKALDWHDKSKCDHFNPTPKETNQTALTL